MACESEHRQTNAHEERQMYDSWMVWVFLFLSKMTIGCNCITWGAAGQEGYLQVVTCFVSTLHSWREHPSGWQSPRSVSFHLGDTPEEGAIGQAERNISTAKEITEHVTDSDHIKCLMKMNLWPTSRPVLFPTTAEGLHHLNNRKWLFFIVPLAQGSAKQWPCPSVDMRTLLRRGLQVYPRGNRTQRQRAKDNRTRGTFK